MVASKILTAALLCVLYSTSYAQSACSMDVAVPIETLVGDGSSGSSLGSSSSTGSSKTDLNDIIENAINGIANEILEDVLDRKLRKRALTCVGTETCFSIGTLPFCIDPVSGDYHNEIEKGNIITGDYVRSDGGKGNLYSLSSSFPSATASVSRSVTATTPRITSTATSSFQTVTTPKGGVGTASVDVNSATASPTSTWWTNAPTGRATSTSSVRAVTAAPPAATALNPTNSSGTAINKASLGAIILAFGFAALLC